MGGGKPATGSVMNIPEPINPAPAAKISDETTDGPTVVNRRTSSLL
jgi:hypothetical protein